jgi:hypothetical protein
MGLTKMQTAALCIALAAIPLVVQHHAQAGVSSLLSELDTELTAKRRSSRDLERQTERDRDALVGLQTELQNADTRLAQVTAQIQGKSPRPTYRWDDNASLVRVSKTAIERLELSAISNRRGQLSEPIKEVLQMSAAEVQATQESLDRFVAGFNAAQAATLRRVEPTPQDLQGHEPQDTRVFEIQALGDHLGALRQELFRELETTLGAQRLGLFRNALRDWMPIEDESPAGMNSGMAVFNFDHRVVFYKPTPGREWLDWQIRKANGEMMSFDVQLDDVPQALRPHVQDWITIARSEAPLQPAAPK